ncbi:hypothetical protein [Caldimonas sp. KR1-144]|uniref:hypothetical protein n=1 Tax=Caldimonas sp. KR1-144 TaxID=3400911 RepID=UPI003C12ADEA
MALLGNDERVLAENLLRAGQGGYFELPFWPDAVQLASDVNVGDSVLPVGAQLAGRGFAAGESLMLIDGLRSSMLLVFDVDEVAGEITLDAPLAQAWPAGARIAPAGFARLQDKTSLGYRSDAVAVGTLRFDFDGEWIWAPAVEDIVYRGYSVLTQQTNWTNEPQAEHSRVLAEVDGQVGRRLVTDLAGVERVSRGHSWLLAGREEIAAFRGFLAARMGRLVPFWLPSLQDDVQLVAGASGAAVALQVANRGLWRLNGTSAAIGRRDLRIVLFDGTVFYRRVTVAAEVSADVEELTIDAALGVAIAPEDVRQISFMRLARLASDAVEIAYRTDLLAECTLALASVRDLT